MDATSKTIGKIFRYVLVLLVCFPITWNLPGHAEAGFRLRQLSCTTGTQNVLVSGNFFKVELPNSSLIITSKAPKWNVLTYNTRSKLYCETPLKDFKVSYINTATQLQLTELAMLKEIAVKQRARTIGGTDYIEYPLMIDQDQTWPAFAGAKGARLLVLADASLPKAAGKILKKICALNSIKTDQVPIKVEVLTKDGTISRFLRTLAGSHITHVEAEAAPKGYTRVAKEDDVIRDKQMQSDIKEILDASDHK